MAEPGDGNKKPTFKVFFRAALSTVGSLSPRQVQRSIKTRVAEFLKLFPGLPSWVDDAAETLPYIDIFVSAVAVLSVIITAEIAHLPWLLPEAIWITLLAVAVFILHWRAEYIRRVHSDRRGATVCVFFIVLAFLAFGVPAFLNVLAHIGDVNGVASKPTSAPPFSSSSGAKLLPPKPKRPHHKLTSPLSPLAEATVAPVPHKLAPLATTPPTPSNLGLSGSLTYRKFRSTPLPTTPPTSMPKPIATVAVVSQSLIDVRPSGSPDDAKVAVVDYTYDGDGVAEDFCFWDFPIFRGDPDTIKLAAPRNYRFNERMRLFPRQTERSTPMSEFARIVRGATPDVPISAIYSFNKYENAAGQMVTHEDAFVPNGNGFIPYDPKALPQYQNLSAYANQICRE